LSGLTFNIYKDLLKIRAPPYSPDLNPIKMVWADMKKYIASQMCESIEQVSLAISEYLASLTPEKCRKYIFH
jgi:transposase